ncbi:Hok/Gef family protein, partial [Escherichia coli]
QMLHLHSAISPYLSGGNCNISVNLHTLFYKGVFLFIAIYIAALLAYTALNRTLCEASIGQGDVQVAAKFAYEAKESR